MSATCQTLALLPIQGFGRCGWCVSRSSCGIGLLWSLKTLCRKPCTGSIEWHWNRERKTCPTKRAPRASGPIAERGCLKQPPPRLLERRRGAACGTVEERAPWFVKPEASVWWCWAATLLFVFYDSCGPETCVLFPSLLCCLCKRNWGQKGSSILFIPMLIFFSSMHSDILKVFNENF